MRPVGVYVHIPFCIKKCKYCDFASYPIAQQNVPAYFDALIGTALPSAAELLTTTARAAETIYIGGGTPTAVARSHLTELLTSCLKMLPISADVEVTVESNPGTVDTRYISEILACGGRRISVGAQSFNDKVLRFLGRIHSADQARSCIENVRAMGCRNINIDLIYGTPGESLDELMRSVETAVSLAPEHISVYGLSIPEGTTLHKSLKAGQFALPSPDQQRQMYETIRDSLHAAGFLQYEVSSWAKPGFECRHNLNYWRRGEYIGLGCAASSYLDGVRRKNVDNVAEYIERVANGGSAVCEAERLSGEERVEEAIMLGLRLREGISLSKLRRDEGIDLKKARQDELQKLTNAKLINIQNDVLRLTDDGVLVADEIIAWLA
ncbi:MAG TPA: radical SAM family heme chaperone HemW [bacterium]|nr:radical SAM family heme chaperone HemW [bacterium]